MDERKIIESNQDQAIGSWINYLNQVRLNNLVESLSSQDKNFNDAVTSIDNAFVSIQSSIIDRNRGGSKGMHGFIAEIAECGIGNAKQQIHGNEANYRWVDDNGPVDLVRDGIDIQQKFVNSGNYLSLKAISEHLERYPDYVKNGGIYQIPEDHYEKIEYLLNIPKDVANKMPTSDGSFSLKQWEDVHRFFGNDGISLNEVEPSNLTYNSVQANKIESTFELEKEELKHISNTNKKSAYKKSLPTVNEGVKIAFVSGVIEGGSTFTKSIIKKKKAGKKISEFDINDWKEVSGNSGKGFLKGNVRGASIYTLTNYTATPAAVASSLVTASFGVAEQAHLLRQKEISELEFIENSEMLCMDVSISALSSFIGQTFIPIPVVGAVIGNTVGMVMYQAGRGKLSEYEQRILCNYKDSLQKLDGQLDDEYIDTIRLLSKDIELYMDLLDNAFSEDIEIAFKGSVYLAKNHGVDKDKILDSSDMVHEFFMS